MTIRKKHATVATVLILVLLAILIVVFVTRSEEEPAPILVTTPVLTASNIEPTVSVEGETNTARQQQAGSRLKERFSTEIGG